MKRLLLLLFLMLWAPLRAEPVDLVITGGTLVTVDASDTLIEDGYVAVDKGRIVGLGPMPCRFEGREVIDATGKAVLPGLVNTHTHLPMVLFRGLADDLALKEWLEGTIFPAEARYVDADFVAVGTRLGLAELIRGGVTTFADMYYFEDTLAEETEKAGVRAVLGQTVLDFPAPDQKSWPEMMAELRRFGTRWRGHPLITPAFAPHAPYTVSPAHYREVQALAEEMDLPILTHLAEADSEVEHTLKHYGLRPVPLMEKHGLLTPRLLAAHLICLEPAEIETLVRSGVGGAHCPQSNMKVAVGTAPVPELLAAGARLGLGTDGAASNNDLDLWEEMDSAAKLHKSLRRDPTVVPAPQAFRMATMGGARALHMEDEIGSLEVGKAADIILLDLEKTHFKPRYNLYSLLVYAAGAGDVTHTIVGGKILMRDRRLLTIDEVQVWAEVERYQNLLRSRKSHASEGRPQR